MAVNQRTAHRLPTPRTWILQLAADLDMSQDNRKLSFSRLRAGVQAHSQEISRDESNVFAGLRSWRWGDRSAEAVKRDRTRKSAGNLDLRAATTAMVGTIMGQFRPVVVNPRCVFSLSTCSVPRTKHCDIVGAGVCWRSISSQTPGADSRLQMPRSSTWAGFGGPCFPLPARAYCTPPEPFPSLRRSHASPKRGNNADAGHVGCGEVDPRLKSTWARGSPWGYLVVPYPGP